MKISVETRKGQVVLVDYDGNGSMMEAIRDSGIDEIEALCGGQAACATCHIYVDSESLHLLPPKNPVEDGLLEYSDYGRPTSRLACQIPCSEKLNGVRVVIAPKD
jgi:ferredoxin, 2Fe-2S